MPCHPMMCLRQADCLDKACNNHPEGRAACLAQKFPIVDDLGPSDEPPAAVAEVQAPLLPAWLAWVGVVGAVVLLAWAMALK